MTASITIKTMVLMDSPFFLCLCLVLEALFKKYHSPAILKILSFDAVTSGGYGNHPAGVLCFKTGLYLYMVKKTLQQ